MILTKYDDDTEIMYFRSAGTIREGQAITEGFVPLTKADCEKAQAKVAAFSEPESKPSTGQIYLYGEEHHDPVYTNKQFELWRKHYTENNMRHVFVECSYFSAEILNIWMKADNDDILINMYGGAASFDFECQLKKEFPETVFHGTDVAHEYQSIGPKFLQYLKENGMADGKQYRLTEGNIEQGRLFYQELHCNHSLRANLMTRNFIREFDDLNDESIMSLHYGSNHVHTGSYHPCIGGGVTMSSRLKKRYGDKVHAARLSELIAPGTPDTVFVGGKQYNAAYFGKTVSDDGTEQTFWRLKNTYDVFKDNQLTGNTLPYDKYPMPVQIGQILVICSANKDGDTETKYYRASGLEANGVDFTEEILIN